jgi:hypothetical protein
MLSGAILGNSSGKLIEKKYVYAGQELQVKKGNFCLENSAKLRASRHFLHI